MNYILCSLYDAKPFLKLTLYPVSDLQEEKVVGEEGQNLIYEIYF